MAGAYFVLTIIGGVFTDSIIFQPPSPGYRDDASVLKLTSADGARISAKYFPNANAKFTLLFSHGNAEDMGYDAGFLEDIRNAGFSVFAYDYQGYGTSKGKPSEEHLYEDSEAAYNYLTNDLHVPPNRIIAWGRSLGGAASSQLVAKLPASVSDNQWFAVLMASLSALSSPAEVVVTTRMNSSIVNNDFIRFLST